MTATTTPVAPWATPTTPAPPLAGFTTRYNTPISDVDNDDIVLTGHVGRLRALATIRAHLRAQLDRVEADEVVRRHLTYDGDDVVRHTYAVLVEHCAAWPGCLAPGGVCADPSCALVAEHDWWIDYPVDPGVPGAFPVTYWRG